MKVTKADPSTLIFISPKGILTDSAYYKANGSMLSLLSQDLFIANNKLYIISQKAETTVILSLPMQKP